jgi:DnaJ-class molecular chaperone
MVHQNPDPYAVPGVTPQATQAQIAHAYRTQVRALHPDTRNTPTQITPGTDAQLRHVLAAYAQLRHPDHDHTDAVGTPIAPFPPGANGTLRADARIAVGLAVIPSCLDQQP